LWLAVAVALLLVVSLQLPLRVATGSTGAVTVRGGGAAMLDSAVYGTLNRYDSNMTGSEWQICKVAHIFYSQLYYLNLWCDEWTLEGSGGQFP
jgi:hypothetical protein